MARKCFWELFFISYLSLMCIPLSFVFSNDPKDVVPAAFWRCSVLFNLQQAMLLHGLIIWELLTCGKVQILFYYVNTSVLLGFLPLCSHSISHSFAALTRSILMWTLEDKFHISARPCIILFIRMVNNYLGLHVQVGLVVVETTHSSKRKGS